MRVGHFAVAVHIEPKRPSVVVHSDDLASIAGRIRLQRCKVNSDKGAMMSTSRLQLALNVSDIEQATAFYSTLFGTEPHKVRPG